MCITVIGLSSHSYYISTHFGFLQLLIHVNNFKGDEKSAPLYILLIPPPVQWMGNNFMYSPSR